MSLAIKQAMRQFNVLFQNLAVRMNENTPGGDEPKFLRQLHGLISRLDRDDMPLYGSRINLLESMRRFSNAYPAPEAFPLTPSSLSDQFPLFGSSEWTSLFCRRFRYQQLRKSCLALFEGQLPPEVNVKQLSVQFGVLPEDKLQQLSRFFFLLASSHHWVDVVQRPLLQQRIASLLNRFAEDVEFLFFALGRPTPYYAGLVLASLEEMERGMEHPAIPRTPFEEGLQEWLKKGGSEHMIVSKLEAIDRIRAVYMGEQRCLDLSGLKLQDLPAVIGSCTHLFRLNLNDNRLITLPGELAQLIHLEYIQINNNPEVLYQKVLETLPQCWKIQNQFVIRSNNNRSFFYPYQGFIEFKDAISRLFTSHFPPQIDLEQLSSVLRKRTDVEMSSLSEFLHFIRKRIEFYPDISKVLLAHTVQFLRQITENEGFLEGALDLLGRYSWFGTLEPAPLFYFSELGRIFHLCTLQAKGPQLAEELIGLLRERLVMQWVDLKKEETVSLKGSFNLRMHLSQLLKLPIQLIPPYTLSDVDNSEFSNSLRECVSYVLDRTTTIEALIPFFKTLPVDRYWARIKINWMAHLEEEFAADLALLATPEDRSEWKISKTKAWLSELGYGEMTFDDSLLIWSLCGAPCEERETAAARIRKARNTRNPSLDLSGLHLYSLPSAIQFLPHLTKLDVSDNFLETLPPEILQLTALSYLDLRGNEYFRESEVLWDLPLFWTFDDLKLDIFLPLSTTFPPKLLAFLYLKNHLLALILNQFDRSHSRKDLARVLRQKEASELNLLTRFFRSLEGMNDYTDPARQPHTLKRIGHILQGFVESESFLNATVIDLTARAMTCIDEAAMTFSQIEVLHLLHCLSPQADAKGLARILIGLHRLELVDIWVMIRSVEKRNRLPGGKHLLDLRHKFKGRLLNNSEALEGSLAMRIHLKETLQLPIQVNQMQFTGCAEQEVGNLEEAGEACGREVLSLTTQCQALLPLLMENDQWKEKVGEERESGWVALQDQAPLSQYHEFLLNFHDSTLTDKMKTAPLKETPLSINQPALDGQGSLFHLQTDVMQEMERLRHKFLCDQTYDLLCSLHFEPCEPARLDDMQIELYKQEVIKKTKRSRREPLEHKE